MTIRSRAPLRIGLAGGGTDVSPFCDLYGGAVLNATISMYAYCTIQARTDGKILFEATDRKEKFETQAESFIPIDGNLPLHKGIYNFIVRTYNGGEPLPITVTTYSDAPAGSGLGSSSTMVVAILKAYIEMLKIPLGEYDIAKIAYVIEREEVGLSGGKQDQYAATFGGFNFMEFTKDNVIVNPLRIKRWIINELECSLILYFTGVSRSSAEIIDHQIESAKKHDALSLGAMEELKKQAYAMKNALLLGDIDELCGIMNQSWQAKKKVSAAISNADIDKVYDFVMANGGKAAKISGAGGGGFMMILCDPAKRKDLIDKLGKLDGKPYTVNFELDGTRGWTIYE